MTASGIPAGRYGRPVALVLSCARVSRCSLIGEANDYTGKGLSWWPHGGAPDLDFRLACHQQHHRGQHRAVRRDHRRGLLLPVWPASALPCACRAPRRWSKAPATMAANDMTGVKFRWRCWARPAATPAGMSGGVAYVYDEDGQFRQPLQHRHGGAGAGTKVRRAAGQHRCRYLAPWPERRGAAEEAAAGPQPLNRSRRARDILENWTPA